MPDIFDQASLNQPQSTSDDIKQDLTDAVDISKTFEKSHIRRKHKPPQALNQSQIQPITSGAELTQATQPLDVSGQVSPAQPAQVSSPTTTDTGAQNTQAEQRVGLIRHVDEYSEVMRQERPKKSRFHAYIPKPVDMSFASQVSNEQIILVLRQHPITQLHAILAVLGMIAGYFFLQWLGFFSFLPTSYQVGMTLFWFLVIIGYSFATFLKWLYNMYIITDERIIDVDVYSLLKRNLTSAKIDHIQDVTAANYGLLGSIFDVGIVVVQTAGTHPMLEFGGVPHPARVVTLINELMLEEEREKIEGRVI
jgi:hypothetical protein